ncbi:MAG: hypothetical protein R6V83_03720 [Candidatus Thorarchaeota archaeon]
MESRRRRIFVVLLLITVLVGLGGSHYFIQTVHGLSWYGWSSKLVGDISESHISDYWTVASSPKSGYENYLWSNWHDVVDSEHDYWSNNDKEMVFSTYSSSSTTVGHIEFKSKASIQDTEKLIFKGRLGARFTYSGVRTFGWAQIYDITSQEVVESVSIKSGTNANTWKWETFSKSISLNKNHQYIIRLKAKDAWIQQKVEIAWECAEVWFHGQDSDYGVPLQHGTHTWRYEWRGLEYWAMYECRVSSDVVFHSTPIEDMLRDHRPYVLNDLKPLYSQGDPTGWDPCYLHEFRSDPFYKLEGDEWYSTDFPGSIGYTDSCETEELDDGYEEIEVYTRNPDLFVSGRLLCVHSLHRA